MSTSDIQQAREWAKKYQRHHVIGPEDELAAVRVIQSLPDQWINADRVREVLDMWAGNPSPTSDEVAVLNDFEALITPSLPTLADMAPEERDAQKWMQAQVFPTASTLGIITGVDEYARSAIILFADGMAKNVPWAFITPRPDLPKLQWPGSHADTITAESVEDVQAGRVADFEPALPRPEDVYAGGPWKVLHDGHEWVGTRESRVEIVCSWALARLDGADYTVARDDEITLISRLVPEVKP